MLGNNRPRRRALVVVAAALLGACGSAGGRGSGASTETSAAPPTAVPTAALTEPPTVPGQQGPVGAGAGAGAGAMPTAAATTTLDPTDAATAPTVPAGPTTTTIVDLAIPGYSPLHVKVTPPAGVFEGSEVCLLDADSIDGCMVSNPVQLSWTTEMAVTRWPGRRIVAALLPPGLSYRSSNPSVRVTVTEVTVSVKSSVDRDLIILELTGAGPTTLSTAWNIVQMFDQPTGWSVCVDAAGALGACQ